MSLARVDRDTRDTRDTITFRQRFILTGTAIPYRQHLADFGLHPVCERRVCKVLKGADVQVERRCGMTALIARHIIAIRHQR